MSFAFCCHCLLVVSSDVIGLSIAAREALGHQPAVLNMTVRKLTDDLARAGIGVSDSGICGTSGKTSHAFCLAITFY